MKKEILLKILRYFLIGLFSMLIISWILISVFKEEIQQGIVEKIESKTQLNINYSNTKLSFWKNFPGISLQINEFQLKTDNEKEELSLDVSRLIASLRLPSLILGAFEIKKMSFEDGYLFLNPDYFDQNSANGKTPDLNLDILHLRNIDILIGSQSDNPENIISVRNINCEIDQDQDRNFKFRLKGFVLPELDHAFLNQVIGSRMLECDLSFSYQVSQQILEINKGVFFAAGNQIGCSGHVNHEQYFLNLSVDQAKIQRLKHLFISYFEDVDEFLQINPTWPV